MTNKFWIKELNLYTVVIILLLCFILSVASISGYIYLNNKIAVGEELIAEGQQQVENGKSMLADGKARLAAGKRKLAAGKRLHSQVSQIPFLGIADKIVTGGHGLGSARGKIAAGSRRVAQGERDIAAGEKRLNDGIEELRKSGIRLGQANLLRMAFGFSSVFFLILTVGLSFYWRRILSRFFK